MLPKSIEEFYRDHPIQTLEIKNTKWEYISCGNGKETILIFPGGGQSAQANFRLIEALESKYKVIACTIYNVDSISDFCFAINSILRKEKIEKVILYGLSIGGMMAQSYLKRNPEKVSLLILSHCCTPRSSMYKKKVLQPLLLLNIFLPLIPSPFISFFSKHFAGKLQGVSNQTNVMNSEDQEKVEKLTKEFTIEFRETYLNKKLLKTWINLHKDFSKENFSEKDFSNWKGKILILRSDNDPLVQDEGDVKHVYPNATVYVFHGSGHLTYYYQFPSMIKEINDFLNNKV